MKTSLHKSKNFFLRLFFGAFLMTPLFAKTQSGTSLIFENPALQSGTDLQVGAKYLFSNVQSNIDAVVSIDSLINGAKINKIDDNSNGTGYKNAFQPAIQVGGAIGSSYAVFTINFYTHGTNNPITLGSVYATAVDIDGNNNLKEFAQINLGSSGYVNFLPSTTDISVNTVSNGNFLGQNILGVERNGIDTSTIANMFTASTSNISSFSIKYGAIATNTSSAVRQYSLYMKPFAYPGSTLPVSFASFTATININNKVDLKWTTASEINVSHFVVERSTDGVNYTDAAVVFAYGNTTDMTSYNYSDNLKDIQSAIIYYRLRSVDVDGKSMYSETRIIRTTKQAENTITIVTFPNPVTSEVRISIPANWQNKKVVYEVVNSNGQVVKKSETASSSQTETVNMSNVNRGFYVIKVSCEGQTAQQKIIKQ